MPFDKFVLKKLLIPYIWRRIFRERLTEPLHLNIIAAFVAVFGTYRAKIDFDLVIRPHHAFALLKAADYARAFGIPALTAVEFGVANGAGLLNMCKIADRITRITGMRFDIVGFDTGSGMPASVDYRDHPEHYRVGDYPMQSPDALLRLLPPNASLRFGPLRETVPAFIRQCRNPVGFISIDVDYYSSTVDALQILTGPPEMYLPLLPIYVDDMNFEGHSEYAGELLAIREFNDEHALRKITKFNMLRERRIFQRAIWIEQMFTGHIFDHPSRIAALKQVGTAVLTNPYL
jgi:hypothetical protein